MTRRTAFLATFLLLVFQGVLAQAVPASSKPLHPVHLSPDTNAATCLECHSTLKSGKYVHTALEMGCTACHVIKEVGANGTSVALNAPVDKICFTCHTKSSDPVQHLPYSEGACVVCHSPHSSNFPAHTRVAHQDLCMGCHVKGLPKVNQKKKTVTVPWGRTLAFKQMKGWYYLGLNATHTANHPVMGHPVSGPNTLLGKNAPDITCLSCHQAHVSTKPNLRPPKFANQTDLCVSCHTDF